jgi:hypothetical protein
LIRIGKKAPMKVMNTMLCSADANSRMAIGIHATAGIGRSTSSGGQSAWPARRKRPIKRPSVVASTAAIEKPRKTRRTLFATCSTNLGAVRTSSAASTTSLGAGMFSKRKK